MKSNIVTPEVVYNVETWKADEFTTQLIDIKRPSSALDSSGRILFYHTMTMEAGKVSIAAALMTAIELHKAKLEHPSEFESWCEANLRHGSIRLGRATVYRYLSMLNKTIGRNCSIDELVHDSEQGKMEAVATFTKYTNYQSLYQLYHCEEIVKSSNLGGAGRGQGRKPKSVSDAAAASEAADAPEFAIEGAARAAADLWRCGVTKSGFAAMENGVLEKLISLIDDILANAKAQLKAKKAK